MNQGASDLHARRAYQGVAARPGEVELMQSTIPFFYIMPLLLLIWACMVFLRTRRGSLNGPDRRRGE